MPRQQAAHARQQLRKLEGFGHVLISAGVKTANAIFREGSRGEDQYRDVNFGSPQLLQYCVPAHLREHEVKDHQVEGFRTALELADRRWTVFDQRGFVSLGLAVELERHTDVPLVFDDQNALA